MARTHAATESWIYFRALAAVGLKTSRWEVLTKDSGAVLGTVSWFARWRRYAFFPAAGTCFEQDCLRRLAGFCEAETTTHREKKLPSLKGPTVGR